MSAVENLLDDRLKDQQCEISVLACLITYRDCLEYLGQMTDSLFTLRTHQVIFNAIKKSYESGNHVPSMPSGTDEATGFNLLNDLIRRTAVICLAESTAKRAYVSYDDALNTRTIVCQYLDQELKIAGDQGLDDTYNALMNLRISVAQDLTRRGADLAKVEQITAAASLPSLVWAQRLYQDSQREKELVKSANPIHPAFMPINFKALSS